MRLIIFLQLCRQLLYVHAGCCIFHQLPWESWVCGMWSTLSEHGWKMPSRLRSRL